MMTCEVLTVSCYAGIASVLVLLGEEAIKFKCFKGDLLQVLDVIEDVAIGRADRAIIDDLPIS